MSEFTARVQQDGDTLRALARANASGADFAFAATQFAQSAPKYASQVLREIMFDADAGREARLAAAAALGKLNNQNDFNVVLSAFILNKTDDPLVLIKALGEFGNTAAVTALISAYAAAAWPTRLAIVEALARLGDPETLNFFSELFNDTIPPPQGVPYDASTHKAIVQLAGETMSKFLVF